MKRKALRKLRLGKPCRLTAGLTNHEHPAISPDGRLIAYYAGPYGSIQVSVADMQGRFAWAVSPQGGNNTQPAWHPSGDALAFRHQHSNDSKWELWEAKLEGDALPCAILADPQWHYKHPFYDPAGARLTYFTDEGSAGVYHIWILDLASGERCQVTFGDAQMHCHPVFSPDGGRIVYHAYEGTDETKVPAVVNLFELDIASGAVRELTTGTDQYKHPFYLDGSVITFHHERNSDGRRQLCAMHLKSREMVKLTDGKANDKHPCPWIDGKGRQWLAWASKKLGTELAAEAIDFDIFIAPLR
jgi:Tol biopolymer transport system component